MLTIGVMHMRDFFKKLVTFKNIMGLFYIVFYFCYVGVNMYNNKGNYIINSILLTLTCVYLLLYIYSVFIEKNKKVRRQSKKIFIRIKKFLGFVNASMIVASVFSNDDNSFWTVFFAVITILWFLIFTFIDITSSIALHEFKRYKKELGWKYDNRN